MRACLIGRRRWKAKTAWKYSLGYSRKPTGAVQLRAFADDVVRQLVEHLSTRVFRDGVSTVDYRRCFA